MGECNEPFLLYGFSYKERKSEKDNAYIRFLKNVGVIAFYFVRWGFEEDR